MKKKKKEKKKKRRERKKKIKIKEKKIFRVENNFLLNKYINDRNGVAVIAIHNRSVDMLLKWINTKTETTTLYKKVKIEMFTKTYYISCIFLLYYPS